MKRVVRLVKRGDHTEERIYWHNQTPEDRLRATTEMMEQYALWKFGYLPRLQRVVTIIKRK